MTLSKAEAEPRSSVRVLGREVGYWHVQDACPWIGSSVCPGCPSRIPSAFSRFLSSLEPPLLFLSSTFGNVTDLFKLSFL